MYLCSKVQVRLAENKWKKNFPLVLPKKTFVMLNQFFRHSMAEKYEIAIIPR